MSKQTDALYARRLLISTGHGWQDVMGDREIEMDAASRLLSGIGLTEYSQFLYHHAT